MCPLSVKIIAAMSMIYSGLAGIPKVLIFLNADIYEGTKNLMEAGSSQSVFPVPFSLQLFHSFLSVFVVFISGIYMLKGQSWALYLLTAWIAASLAFTFVIVGMSSYVFIKLLAALIILVILYNGKSRAYLLRNRSTGNE